MNRPAPDDPAAAAAAASVYASPMDENSDWLATDLCAALHALSLEADEALAMQEPGFRRPERMALMFGNAVLKAIEQPPGDLTPTLLRALNELAALLNQMSTQPNTLWTEEAVLNDPSWREVQTLARRALTELGINRESRPLH